MTIKTLKDAPTAEQLKKEYDRRSYRRDFFRSLTATISSVIVFAAVFVLVCNFVFPVLRVTGSGMSPTLSSNEIVLCSKVSAPEKGDIIAFYHNKKILIKRIIGTPEDVIDIDDKGNVYVNGSALDEPYAVQKGQGECDVNFPYTVPSGRYFVMGDNRVDSVDSRYSGLGCAAEEDIIGRINIRIWPLEAVGKPR